MRNRSSGADDRAPALEAAKAFGTIDDVRVSAIIDENDSGGPAIFADMERLTKMMPAALSIENGAHVWRTGEEVQTEVIAVDGTTMPGELPSPNDVLILAETTPAPKCPVPTGGRGNVFTAARRASVH